MRNGSRKAFVGRSYDVIPLYHLLALRTRFKPLKPKASISMGPARIGSYRCPSALEIRHDLTYPWHGRVSYR
jgi:hypothetical protein